jgi:hypothetical protein
MIRGGAEDSQRQAALDDTGGGEMAKFNNILVFAVKNSQPQKILSAASQPEINTYAIPRCLAKQHNQPPEFTTTPSDDYDIITITTNLHG